MKYLNETQVPLSMAVYLAADMYDYVPDAISATSLIKPTRQLVLAKRVPAEENATDILSLAKSRIGTSIHDGIEKAWVGGHYKRAMAALGYPDVVIDRITINNAALLEAHGYDIEGLMKAGTYLDLEAPPENPIPVYTEIRNFRRVGDKLVSGKFDFLAEGRLEDVKSTSTFTWINQTKTEDYKLQGSIYRWLNPKIITKDEMAIQFVFTDFMAGKANSDPKYPKRQVETQRIPLMSLEDTEQFVQQKLIQVEQFLNADESSIPKCSDKDLWRKPPVYKYYKDPAKRTRSTKNFDNPQEAYLRLQKDGNVGIVVEVPGEVVACKYCAAFSACNQKNEYIADGSLKID